MSRKAQMDLQIKVYICVFVREVLIGLLDSIDGFVLE